jgi:hypothetical protein
MGRIDHRLLKLVLDVVFYYLSLYGIRILQLLDTMSFCGKNSNIDFRIMIDCQMSCGSSRYGLEKVDSTKRKLILYFRYSWMEISPLQALFS